MGKEADKLAFHETVGRVARPMERDDKRKTQVGVFGQI